MIVIVTVTVTVIEIATEETEIETETEIVIVIEIEIEEAITKPTEIAVKWCASFSLKDSATKGPLALTSTLAVRRWWCANIG